jgi:acyl carrier protein
LMFLSPLELGFLTHAVRHEFKISFPSKAELGWDTLQDLIEFVDQIIGERCD